MDSAPKKRRKIRKALFINVNSTRYPSVRECALELGFNITNSSTKSVINWHDAEGRTDIVSSLQPWQFYNHFPGTTAISRKVELAKNLERMRRMLPELYCFYPRTFLLPMQHEELQTFMSKRRKTIIVKPDRGSQGRGIFLAQDPSSIEDYMESAVAQVYAAPLLIDGYKFDLRIYVLITSIEPLRIYIHEEGMARFCTEKYVKPKGNNLSQKFSHLTNYSLNKKNEKFVENADADESDVGSKRSMSSVFSEIAKMGHDVAVLRRKIDDIIRLTVSSVQPLMATNYRAASRMNDGKSRCFEILGFDIMIDKNVNPLLIEVNCMPSLRCNSPLDTQLKSSVIMGTLKILNIPVDFKTTVKRRMKDLMMQRIGTKPVVEVKSMFDPQQESDIAKETNWRQIWPVDIGDESFPIVQQALTMSRQNPVGVVAKPSVIRIRKEKAVADVRPQQINYQRSSSQGLIVNKPIVEPRRVQRLESSKRFIIQTPVPRKRVMTPCLARPPPFLADPDQIMAAWIHVKPEWIDDMEESERRLRIKKNAEKAELLSMSTYIRMMVRKSTRAAANSDKKHAIVHRPARAKSLSLGTDPVFF